MERENELIHVLKDGPAKNMKTIFTDVLTVPQELRQEIFYWPEEREFCEQVSSTGRALDTLTTVHRTLLGQFKLVSNLRASLIQAPTEFFVAPMYFCDRALDSLLHSIRKVQNDIAGLFNDLNRLEAECLWRYKWTKRAFLEDKYPKDNTARKELARQPDMNVKERRVNLLAELSERIGMVRKGGSGMFSLLDRRWLLTGARDETPQRSGGVISVAGAKTSQEDPFAENDNRNTRQEIEGSGSVATPVPHSRSIPDSRSAGDGENLAEVPETPEAPHVGDVVVTQRSSPRKRKPSQSSGRSEDIESTKQVQNVARNLVGDGTQGFQGFQDSPAQKSGASIVAMRGASQRDGGEILGPARVESSTVGVENRIDPRSCNDRGSGPAFSRTTSLNARITMQPVSQEHEANDKEGAQSVSI